MATEVVTRTRRYFLGDDGIVRVTVLPGAEETLADAMENVRAGGELLGVQRRPVLDDSRRIKSVERDARAYYAGPEATRMVSAAAVLIGSPIQRIILNFFVMLNKPPFPVRFFTSEAEAVVWLKGFVR